MGKFTIIYGEKEETMQVIKYKYLSFIEIKVDIKVDLEVPYP